MPKVNEKEKSFTLLEKEVFVISAVNNPKLSPYLDIFRHYPENILLQPLGILTGFFRINEFGEELSYIVNFLSSVLKKEYYANPKRAIENSFDSALRKVNLALSEIAKEGNINWLGRIDGAVCILEKNNFHFSVCGKAKIFLFRNQLLTEISKEMAIDDAEPNPLKTFINVSSGRLEKGDRIIVCEDNVFEVFSEEEIRKGAIRFPKEKFVQFIKTALINKLDMVGAIVIDIFEKEKPKPVLQQIQPDLVYNVFSKKVFEEKKIASKGLKEMLKEETDKKEYTDGKTGHIYIQEEEKGEIKKKSNFAPYWLLFKEKMGDFFFWLKNKSKRNLSGIRRSMAKSKDLMAEKIRLRREEAEKIKMEKIKEKTEAEAAYPSSDYQNTEPEISEPTIFDKHESFLAKLESRREELIRETASKEEKKSFLKRLVPDFGKIKGIFSSLGRKQKIYTLIIIAAILIVPFAFLKIQSAMNAKPVVQQPEEKIPDAKEIFSQEKNIVFLDNIETIASIQNPLNIANLNGRIIATSQDKIITREGNGEIKEFSWPQNFGTPQEISPMSDLNLALIYTSQSKVISFLSATSQFSENKIGIPENSKITGAGTYLTYLYLLDSQSNQIYRYPRAEGGFGDKTNWLKETINLENSCCVVIDENVYLINQGAVLKLFKGQKQEFNLENTNIPFTLDGIFTNSETQNIYALDKSNGRIIKFSKDGSIASQYFHEDIKKATGFTADEKNNKVYIISPNGLLSFSIN